MEEPEERGRWKLQKVIVPVLVMYRAFAMKKVRDFHQKHSAPADGAGEGNAVDPNPGH